MAGKATKSRWRGGQRQDAEEHRVVVDRAARATRRSTARPQQRTSTFVAHDEKNEAKIGDTVEIAETRPLSQPQAMGAREAHRQRRAVRAGDARTAMIQMRSILDVADNSGARQDRR